MNFTRLLFALFLIAAVIAAVVGGAMYFQSPKGAMGRLIGILMLAGAGGFGLLALAILLVGPPKSRLRSVHRDTPFNRFRFHVGMLVGVVFGTISILYAISGLYTGEYPGGRRASGPTRLSESPGWFTINFILSSGMGVGLLWLCLPPVLRMFSPPDRE